MNNLFYNINPFSLSKRIGRPLILDGAIGSYLQEKKINTSGRLWSSLANIENPKAVLKLHKDYIAAGADIITTNTFRTNPEAANSNGYNSSVLVKAALQLAKEAVNKLPVFIAGSNAPAEDCYQDERTISRKRLEKNHKTHIDLLISNGSQFILNETQSHFDEIKIICEYCFKNDIPYVLSIFMNENLKILSGENVWEIINFAIDYNPLAISFNCIKPQTFEKLYKTIKTDSNWGLYLNCGSGDYGDESIACGISPIEYKQYIEDKLTKQPSFIGACCGSSPSHINEIKRLLDERINN
jgi:homocysteine S-methyltransferase